MPDTATTVDELGPALEAVWRGSRVLDVAPIPQSHSGFTYAVSAEVEGAPVRSVLRLPPPGARTVGPADIARQARIMGALFDAGAPVPRILASSDEPVLDGRPFVVMERVAAVGHEEAFAAHGARHVVRAAFEAIRVVHGIPTARTGIGDEEVMSPRGEVERWAALRTRAPEELVVAAPTLEERLLARVPRPCRPVLVHGDYHPGNLLFAPDGAVAAILDWEISELGEGPFDEAALCMLAVRADFGEPYPGAGHALGLDEMRAMAGPIADLDWYLAATCHKYGSILAYNTGLHRRGKRVDPVYDELTTTIPGLIDAGLRFLD